MARDSQERYLQLKLARRVILGSCHIKGTFSFSLKIFFLFFCFLFKALLKATLI